MRRDQSLGPVDQNPPNMAEGLSTDFLRIWQSGDFSDVTLLCSDGGRVAAHRQILASRSHYFARMMFGNLKEGGEKEVKLQAKEKVVRLLLTHLYSNSVTMEEEEVGHLAELLDLARMIVDSALEKAVELELGKRIHNEDEAVQVLNESVNRRFTKLAWKSVRAVCCQLKEKVEKKILRRLSKNSLQVLIDTVKHEVYMKESIMSEVLTFWMIFHEVDDEEKDGLMSMVGFEDMKIVDLVEVMEKCQPALKKKIFKAIKEQEQSNENITKGLLDANSELQEQNERLTNDLESTFAEMSSSIGGMREEVERFQRKLRRANRVIESQGADLEKERRRAKVAKRGGQQQQQLHSSRADGMDAVNFRITNLVKHVESSLRKFQNTVEGIIDDNNGEAWIDQEDAGRCHRIMEAVNQGLKSLQENRDGEVLRTPHHTITWHLLFEEVKVQRVVQELLHSTTYLVSTHPENQAWFFQNIEESTPAMNDAIDVLEQVYQQYN